MRGILEDSNVKEEAMIFVNSLIQDDKFVEDILQLLLSALRSATFMSSLQSSSQELVKELLQDQKVQEALKGALVATADSAEVKDALVEVAEGVLGSKRTASAVSGLLANSK